MNIFEKILYFILGLWFLFSASYYFIDAFKSVQSFYKENKIREKEKLKKIYISLLIDILLSILLSILCLILGNIYFFILIFN